MKENLRVRRYNDGTEIRFDATGSSGGVSATWQNLSVGAYTIYAHDSTATPSNLTSYGYLYNWYAAAGIVTPGGAPTKNICPTGWHVPTDTELTTLTTYLGGTTTAGTVMKKNDALWLTNTGTNTSGFSALPGGFRYNNGGFSLIRGYAYFWSATAGVSPYAWGHYMGGTNGNVYRDSYDDKAIGGSVRCLRN
jgi:uncharacterized protein (TIGR02145 family)